MDENHSFGCVEDQMAMGLHDFGLGEAHVCQKPKEITEEQIKQKAKDFIDRVNKESDGMWLNKYYISDLLVMFATEATKELEKENTELRHQLNKNPCVCNTEWHCSDCLEQLTKAKGIIKKLIEAIHIWDCKNLEQVEVEVEVEAEQFLKEASDDQVR